jgi:signal recognition particle receptor subunit beta
MMSVYKIIFTGPVGAGKTTAIASISDIEPFQTEELASDDTKKMKANTTVAMDYGLMKLDDGERIHLYGTPGQERFDFMWEILTEGGIGLILLINNTNPDPFKDLEFYLNSFREFIRETGLAIGVTRMHESPKPNLDDYAKVLANHNLHCPVFEVDARNAEDVIRLTSSLLYSIDPGLQ